MLWIKKREFKAVSHRTNAHCTLKNRFAIDWPINLWVWWKWINVGVCAFSCCVHKHKIERSLKFAKISFGASNRFRWIYKSWSLALPSAQMPSYSISKSGIKCLITSASRDETIEKFSNCIRIIEFFLIDNLLEKYFSHRILFHSTIIYPSEQTNGNDIIY